MSFSRKKREKRKGIEYNNLYLVHPLGVEPRIAGYKPVATYRITLGAYWLSSSVSNREPSDYESDALTIELEDNEMVLMTRFELVRISPTDFKSVV